MDRRNFISASTAGIAAQTFGRIGTARAAAEALSPPSMANSPWRTFEVITAVEIWPQDTPANVWLPMPLHRDTDYQRMLDIRWSGNAASTGLYRDPKFGASAFFATWGKSDSPRLQVTTVIATRNVSVDVGKPGPIQSVAREELELYLQPTAHIPTDGIVRATASRIIPTAAGGTMERARAIYEWIVENTYRDPKVIGCGTGDIRFMLESGNLGGKCADLNALFVGLARSAAFRRATSTACASPIRRHGRASARAATSRAHSTAVPSFIIRISAGYRSIRPMFARSSWRRTRIGCCRCPILAWRLRARRCSAHGR